jgi:hypothetical protein
MFPQILSLDTPSPPPKNKKEEEEEEESGRIQR